MPTVKWETVRDLLLAAGAVALTAAIDYFSGWLSANPLGNAAVTAAILAVLGILRRRLNPTIPIAETLPGANAIGIRLIDQPTPLHGTFAVASDLDDEPFLASCAAQVQAYSGKAKTFDPATLTAILIWLFQHHAEIEALVRQLANWFTALFARWKLRRAVREAVKAKAGRDNEPTVDGIAEWLEKTDAGVLRRVRMIADSKR